MYLVLSDNYDYGLDTDEFGTLEELTAFFADRTNGQSRWCRACNVWEGHEIDIHQFAPGKLQEVKTHEITQG